MKKAFSSRRVPRKVGQDEDEPDATGGNSDSPLKRPSSKPRKPTTLRTSFEPGADGDDEEGADSAGVVIPKRGKNSRFAAQSNTKRSSLLASKPATRPSDDDDDDDRPSYTAASLQSLKDSTPSTPRDAPGEHAPDDLESISQTTQSLDLSNKFGPNLSRYQTTSIPSATEIAEKKARRARLAKEETADEFISLNPSDPDLSNASDDDQDSRVTKDARGHLIVKSKDKYAQAESRLVRDDEDILEGFDDFTEASGQAPLGARAEAEAARKRKADIAAQIVEAEDGGNDSDSASDASERARTFAFEAAQTRHGTYADTGATSNDPYASERPTTPPTVSPLPTLDTVVRRFRARVEVLRAERARKVGEMEGLRREKVRLVEEEVRIQGALRETGEKFRRIREEKGIGAEAEGSGEVARVEEGERAGGDEVEDEGMMGGRGGLGSGARGGLGMGLGMGVRGLDSLEASASATPAEASSGNRSSHDSDSPGS